MPRLNVVSPEQAEGPVKKIYDQLDGKYGTVFNIFQGMGNSAAVLQAYLGFAGSLKSGHLSAEDQEVVYLAVSQKNGCEYCVAAHTAIAGQVGLEGDEILAIRRHSVDDPKQQALIDFALKVQETKGFVADDDLAAVRDAGYGDGEIAEVVAYVALAIFTNFFNHVHDTEVDFPPAPAL